MTIGPKLKGTWVTVDVGSGFVVGITVGVSLGGGDPVGCTVASDCEASPDASNCFTSGDGSIVRGMEHDAIAIARRDNNINLKGKSLGNR